MHEEAPVLILLSYRSIHVFCTIGKHASLNWPSSYTYHAGGGLAAAHQHFGPGD